MPKVRDFDHPEAQAARDRVIKQFDEISAEELKQLVVTKPSLRGMVLGNISELLFDHHVAKAHPELLDIRQHDDHDRAFNKSDRSIHHERRIYRIQVKSIQTGSICWRTDKSVLQASIQNDGSDRRDVKLPSGKTINTTCYRRGDYDVLAVPLYPFTGTIAFAYKLNRDCRSSTFSGYADDDRAQLLATTETITWPLNPAEWRADLASMLDDSIGLCLDDEEADALSARSPSELLVKK